MASVTAQNRTFSPLEKGPIERYHLVEWCAAENDYYILHYDESYARKMGFDAPIVQGTYKLALAGAYVSRIFGEQATITSISMRYLRPDLEGTSLRISAELLSETIDGAGNNYKVTIRIHGENSALTAEAEAEVSTPVV